MVNTINELAHGYFSLSDQPKCKHALVYKRTKPSFAFPLLRRVIEVAIRIIGPRFDLIFVNCFLYCRQQSAGTVGKCCNCHLNPFQMCGPTFKLTRLRSWAKSAIAGWAQRGRP